MRESPFYQDILEEGLQKGRLEGFQEGRLEGLQEGRLEGLQEGLPKGRQEGIRWLLSKIVPVLQRGGFPVEGILALSGLTLADLDLDEK